MILTTKITNFRILREMARQYSAGEALFTPGTQKNNTILSLQDENKNVIQKLFRALDHKDILYF